MIINIKQLWKMSKVFFILLYQICSQDLILDLPRFGIDLIVAMGDKEMTDKHTEKLESGGLGALSLTLSLTIPLSQSHWTP